MALIAGATRITMDGLRAIEMYDAAPFTVQRPATFAEQLATTGPAGSEMLRTALGGLPPGHTGIVNVSGNVVTITVTS